MRILLVAVLLTAIACTPKDRMIVEPGERVGSITRSSSVEDLRKAFGDAAVTDQDIDVGEGMTEKGTVIYAASPQKRLAVLWKAPATRKNPERVIVCYQGMQGDCLWRTSSGVGMNTSLKDLERLNGRDFKLSGFGWDYSGTVSSWEGGSLAKLSKGLIVRLAPDETTANSEEGRTVLGDGDFSSSLSAMQKLNPKVYAMIVEFPQ